MDSDTLDNLKSVFQTTPSSELAKIICLESIKLNRPEDIIPFLSHLSKDINPDESLTIATTLHKLGESNLAIEYLDKDNIDHVILLIQCLLNSDKKDEARRLYIDAVKNNHELESIELNNSLNINPKADFNRPDNRPVLKVIEKTDMASVTDLIRYREDTTTFSDVVGHNQIKKQITKKIILPFQKPSIFQRFKKKIGGGVLLYGPPGCGKTLLARATAGECNANFYNIGISDVLDMYIGESEQKLHAIFEKARAETPSVLFFDELEALAGKREHHRSSSSSNVVSQFLTELDGFTQNNTGVLVLASTNVPWAIDTAFLRPGRFDRMFFVPPPDLEAREGILRHHIKDRPMVDKINFNVFAKKTSGYSGADLFNLIEMAADEAIDLSLEQNEEVEIDESHLLAALKEAKPTTSEWLTTARNYARYANEGGRYNDVLDFLKKHGK